MGKLSSVYGGRPQHIDASEVDADMRLTDAFKDSGMMKKLPLYMELLLNQNLFLSKLSPPPQCATQSSDLHLGSQIHLYL
jgi:hypothetical protein